MSELIYDSVIAEEELIRISYDPVTAKLASNNSLNFSKVVKNAILTQEKYGHRLSVEPIPTKDYRQNAGPASMITTDARRQIGTIGKVDYNAIWIKPFPEEFLWGPNDIDRLVAIARALVNPTTGAMRFVSFDIFETKESCNHV